MNLKKIFLISISLFPTIGNTSEFNQSLENQALIPKINFKSNYDKLQPVSKSARQFDYETADSSSQTVYNITISPRFKTVCSSVKFISENIGGGHSYLFSQFGLIDDNTMNDQDKIPILKIFANNKYKIKSFEGYVDKATIKQLKETDSSTMLGRFIAYHKLPSFYENIISKLPRLKDIFEKNIYYSTFHYFTDLEYIFDTLNLAPNTKSVHIAIYKKDENNFKTDTELADKFLVPLTVDRIQDIIKRAQLHHHRSETLIYKFQKLLPDIIACNSLHKIIETNKDITLFEKQVNREYPWAENMDKINDIDKFKVIIATIFNVERDVERSKYYDQTMRDLSNRIKLLLNSNDQIRSSRNSTETLTNNYEKYMFQVKELVDRIENEFGKLK